MCLFVKYKQNHIQNNIKLQKPQNTPILQKLQKLPKSGFAAKKFPRPPSLILETAAFLERSSWESFVGKKE